MSTIDTGARVAIAKDPARPGWVIVTVERRKRTRQLWLALDEAAQLHQLLGRELPPVEMRRTA